MSDDADFSAGQVFGMSVLDGKNTRSVLDPAPSCILAAGARYTPPTSHQRRRKVGAVRRTGSRRYEFEYSPLYFIFLQVCT